MMNRRDFIKLLTAAVAGGAVLDVDRLLWLPKPMIVVPAMPVELVSAFNYPAAMSWVEHMNAQMVEACGLPSSVFAVPDLARAMRITMLGADEIQLLAKGGTLADLTRRRDQVVKTGWKMRHAHGRKGT